MKRFLVVFLGALFVLAVSTEGNGIPGAQWELRTPDEVGLSREELDALKELVGGRGWVVRHGQLVAIGLFALA